MENVNNNLGKGHLFAALTIIVWGTTFIASKVLLRFFSPLQIISMRFIISFIILSLISRKKEKTEIKDELMIAFMALMGTTVYQYLENRALTYTLASNVSIIIASAPILTAVLAHFFTNDEKLNINVLLGFIIAFAGVMLVVFNGTVVLKLNPIGDIMSFAAALCWAVYSILLKKLSSKFESVFLTRRTMFYAIIFTVPMLVIEGLPFELSTFIQNPITILCILFLGVLGSGFCYVAWNRATSILGTVSTSNYIYMIPFITMIAAALLLKERITVMGALGAVLIVVGVVAAENKRKLFIKEREDII